KIRVVYGPVVRSIIECAEIEDVDLIAIASHGRSGLSRVFYGSAAAGVLNNIQQPLLIIRSGGD
nr:universal stress protein [Candidatus Desulfatibia vada]